MNFLGTGTDFSNTVTLLQILIYANKMAMQHKANS